MLHFKYALALELDDPGFHHSVLSDFRDRLAQDDRADALLDLVAHRVLGEDWSPRAAQKSRRMTSIVRARWGSLRSARWATASSIDAAGRIRGR
ncbi:transposase [Streptomyces sp. S1D4-14]|uniref:transposase n=1 Tax=unclassified Streptomyces TaxID=2593676 RepID=UPI0035C926B8